ncbi:hypothetical protein E2L05_05670 [Meridianimarinicoccus aquatilis]|uniref:Uncharacterized protein n=2 Tax=Meridianimarinicoccus aquatilis TaxID=2552766 RepID=A0A4R6B568_9RHOB|nr:hypothetical protein E2L05_05670 [Fluviibacterium aquatile]
MTRMVAIVSFALAASAGVISYHWPMPALDACNVVQSWAPGINPTSESGQLQKPTLADFGLSGLIDRIFQEQDDNSAALKAELLAAEKGEGPRPCFTMRTD